MLVFNYGSQVRIISAVSFGSQPRLLQMNKKTKRNEQREREEDRRIWRKKLFSKQRTRHLFINGLSVR